MKGGRIHSKLTVIPLFASRVTELLMEHLIATMAAMDPDSPVRASGSDQFLKLLWNVSVNLASASSA